ncbi:patatin-like phospholipase family protein [Sphingomonas sp. H39-1-10]|uniref:patatin-like phospholipase family protein n=1 Tax=Sphingomonas pollutisoli TaxID=3030829 RepID=UPI0023BA2A09|nr:patatin-like phospholipase family protein [Sphingomonas pollutisoli]MDF0486539.1 patatin-like phospholipase family protein [Sphingomonas pollutisoli]
MTPDTAAPKAERDFDVVLVLSGGNALGAFEAGVSETLHTHGLQPDWVVGASIGAINGALIAGLAPDRRIETLRAFWRPNPLGATGMATPWLPSAIETARRTTAVAWTAAAGRPGAFGPLLSSLTPWTDAKPSLFETDQLGVTLARLIDFDLLNAGPCRFTATAVDLETGADVAFDSRHRAIGPDHIRASAALPVVFPPVEIDGRWDGRWRAVGEPPARSRAGRCARAADPVHRRRSPAVVRAAAGDARRSRQPHAGSDLRGTIPPHDRTVAGRV